MSKMLTILQRYDSWIKREHHQELTLYDAFAEGFLQALEWAQEPAGKETGK